VVVLVLVTVVTFSLGVVAATQWLPELADTPTGTIAFFVICGRATFALIGVNADFIVRILSESGLPGGLRITEVNSGLTSLLRDSGTVGGLALVAYLLAPHGTVEARPTE
jgi:hypothetical protein